MKEHLREWTNGKWRVKFEDRNVGQPKTIPAGEWDAEPDKVQWVDSETGLDCLMVRNHFGNWCGYVGVSEGHPLFGVGYSERSDRLTALRDEMLNKPMPENPSFSVLLSMFSGSLEPTPDVVLQAHGGITFADFCHEGQPESEGICHVPAEGRPERVWWFGFDCGHAGDFSPGLASYREFSPRFGDVYRNRAYVENEVTELARQLKSLEAVK